jgi:hypothetical protein
VSEPKSYWGAFLKHPYNQALILGASALSVLASFPYGWDAMALMLLGLAAVEIVGLAIIPGLPNFQAATDKAAAKAAREARRARLLQEIEAHGGSNYVGDYEQMCERVAALYRTASDRSTTLSERDVDQLDTLTVDYLGMCLSDAIHRGQDGAMANALVTKKLKAVEQRLSQSDLTKDEETQLRRAKAEYDELLVRQTRMQSRRSALEASLVSMPVRMEELYQMVMTAPSSGNLSALLEESVSKLRIAEEVAMDVDEVLSPRPVHRATATANDEQAARARRSIGTRL